MKLRFLASLVLAVSLTSCASADTTRSSAEPPSPPHEAQSDQEMSPATPLEFAQRYAEFTENLDAASVNTLVSDQMTLAWANNSPQKTYSREEQLATLTEIYKIEKAAGKKLRPADYIITQHSKDFAVIKFTWEVEDPSKDRLNYAHTSYVIRREQAGWRLIFVMELASAFDGANPAEFSSAD